MAGIKWRKGFHATITTPLDPADIVYGHDVPVVLDPAHLHPGGVRRDLGAVRRPRPRPGPARRASPESSPEWPSSHVVTAFTVTRENEMSLSTLFRFGITPLFLFSGTFFPDQPTAQPAPEGRLCSRLCSTVSSWCAKSPYPGRRVGGDLAADLGPRRLSGGDDGDRHGPGGALARPEAQAMSVSAPSRLTPPRRMTPFRAQRIWERNYLVYRRVWKIIVHRVLRAGVLPVLDRDRDRVHGWGRARARRSPRRLPRLRRPGPDGGFCDERGGAGDDVQHLLPAQVRQRLRRDPHHPDGTSRHRGR